MSDAGRKILDGLKDAIAGNFVAVTIDGGRWVRQDRYDDLVRALEWIAAKPDEDNEWDGRDKFHECRDHARATLATLGSERQTP